MYCSFTPWPLFLHYPSSNLLKHVTCSSHFSFVNNYVTIFLNTTFNHLCQSSQEISFCYLFCCMYKSCKIFIFLWHISCFRRILNINFITLFSDSQNFTSEFFTSFLQYFMAFEFCGCYGKLLCCFDCSSRSRAIC